MYPTNAILQVTVTAGPLYFWKVKKYSTVNIEANDSYNNRVWLSRMNISAAVLLSEYFYF